MARELNRGSGPSPDDLGPGAAVDETLEREVGAEPGERVPGTAHAAPAADIHEEHEPSEHSYWPILLAASVLLIGIGLLSTLAVSVVGAIALMVVVVGWFREPWVS